MGPSLLEVWVGIMVHPELGFLILYSTVSLFASKEMQGGEDGVKDHDRYRGGISFSFACQMGVLGHSLVKEWPGKGQRVGMTSLVGRP